MHWAGAWGWKGGGTYCLAEVVVESGRVQKEVVKKVPARVNVGLRAD